MQGRKRKRITTTTTAKPSHPFTSPPLRGRAHSSSLAESEKFRRRFDVLLLFVLPPHTQIRILSFRMSEQYGVTQLTSADLPGKGPNGEAAREEKAT